MTSLLDRLVAAVPGLPRPVILLEDGIGRGGTARLAWGARHRLVADVLPDALDTRMYGVLTYDQGVELFAPTDEVVVDLSTGRVGRGSLPPAVPWTRGEVTSRAAGQTFDGPGWARAVERIKDYIAAGDVYQVNLALAERFTTSADAWTLYRRLRERNPSPWMGFADFGDWQLVSGSPELLLEVQGREARTRPIAGTRKKTGDAAVNQAMRTELTLDPKEQAEHRMLLDLARNDLGQVAAWGTVHVAEREVIEEYAHVFHLVSEVRATLADGVTPARAARALFPGGTITGAPKRRAMEVIAELEPVPRGAYTGAMGWIDAHGAQLNIVIRSLVVRGGEAVVQAGAGIVWDSDPAREWREALRKGQAMRDVLGA